MRIWLEPKAKAILTARCFEHTKCGWQICVCHWSDVTSCPQLISSLQTLTITIDCSTWILEHHSHTEGAIREYGWSKNTAQQPGALIEHMMDGMYVCIQLVWFYILILSNIRFSNTDPHLLWSLQKLAITMYCSTSTSEHHSHPEGVVHKSCFWAIMQSNNQMLWAHTAWMTGVFMSLEWCFILTPSHIKAQNTAIYNGWPCSNLSTSFPSWMSGPRISDWSQTPVQWPIALSTHSIDDRCECVPLKCYHLQIPPSVKESPRSDRHNELACSKLRTSFPT